ncbi:3-deoxy-7-phosphoheptulonate synthase [Parasporobacterium paucivorans]|uniref:Phospho-2-dehydro-3-deoxyheptonate aldolase n=1 Tax=Parasporobacterium paucivorans DSM 15970 TaxID=1122934 RepID=A0A1M6A769_9FIRM|nr:3-deoxy-7-phosphoheptulonate synthase [Parasporobacterium paucivorans]SHI32364.1 3-deoxy-D-arabinoheptulosonate-7-phosphate synthase [Parasporobacterium paucivorans DSM 15970]
MNCDFKRKLPVPMEIKDMYPLTHEMGKVREKRNIEIKKILSGELNKLLLIIGPCSADNEDSILDYVSRLRTVQDKINDKICIIPRIYTNKPRTTCDGYKGMLHHPDPMSESDMLKGVTQIRKIHMRAIQETGLTCADEMLYPENYRYLSDLLSYVAVGARSVENQQHRLTASALDIPVGMKNPTSGDLSIMYNSITAAQNPHTFIYRGWEVDSKGNPFAHAILRGSTNSKGKAESNYHYETLVHVHEEYMKLPLVNPAVIIDTNHANSNKKFMEQIRISKDVMHSRRQNRDVEQLVKGLMIESYIEDGCQKPEENVYGKSITDPCLGWEKTEKLIYELADLV